MGLTDWVGCIIDTFARRPRISVVLRTCPAAGAVRRRLQAAWASHDFDEVIVGFSGFNLFNSSLALPQAGGYRNLYFMPAHYRRLP